MGIGDIIVLLVIASAVALAIRSIRKSKNAGCTGGCATCGRACAGKHREKIER